MIRSLTAVSLALVVAGSAMGAVQLTPIPLPGSSFNTAADLTKWKSTVPATTVFERDSTSAHEGSGCLKIYNAAGATTLGNVEVTQALDISAILTNVGDRAWFTGYFKTSSYDARKAIVAQWQYKSVSYNVQTQPVTGDNSLEWTSFMVLLTVPKTTENNLAANRLKVFFKISATDTLWVDSINLFKIDIIQPVTNLTALSSGAFKVSANGLVDFPAVTPFTCMLIQPNGRSVFNTSGTAHSVALPLTTLSAGTYLLRTTTNEGSFEQKLQVR
jgi:hypothetical protein